MTAIATIKVQHDVQGSLGYACDKEIDFAATKMDFSRMIPCSW